MVTPLFYDDMMVHTQSHDYPIIITEQCGVSIDGSHQPSLATRITPYIQGQQVLIVSNETIAPLYLQPLQDKSLK